MYVKEDYLNSFEFVNKLLNALGLIAHYYKTTKNSDAMAANAMVSKDLFNEAKKRMNLKKDLEAK